MAKKYLRLVRAQLALGCQNGKSINFLTKLIMKLLDIKFSKVVDDTSSSISQWPCNEYTASWLAAITY
jgi:hypothetical protein